MVQTAQLILNTKKTKELIYDLRKSKHNLIPVNLNDENVEQVKTFKYLGDFHSSDMTWHDNVTPIINKAHKRLFFHVEIKASKCGCYNIENVLQQCCVICYDLLYIIVPWSITIF